MIILPVAFILIRIGSSGTTSKVAGSLDIARPSKLISKLSVNRKGFLTVAYLSILGNDTFCIS
jgi:hypothetical protein